MYYDPLRFSLRSLICSHPLHLFNQLTSFKTAWVTASMRFLGGGPQALSFKQALLFAFSITSFITFSITFSISFYSLFHSLFQSLFHSLFIHFLIIRPGLRPLIFFSFNQKKKCLFHFFFNFGLENPKGEKPRQF